MSPTAHEQSGHLGAHDLADRPDVAGDEGKPDGSRLGQDHGQAVTERRKAEDVGGAVQRDQFGAVRTHPVMDGHTWYDTWITGRHQIHLDIQSVGAQPTDGVDEQESTLALEVAADEEHTNRSVGARLPVTSSGVAHAS